MTTRPSLLLLLLSACATTATGPSPAGASAEVAAAESAPAAGDTGAAAEGDDADRHESADAGDDADRRASDGAGGQGEVAGADTAHPDVADAGRVLLDPGRAPGPADPLSLLVPCLPDERSLEALELALDRAFDARDARCWSAVEIALGHVLLAREETVPDAVRQAAYRFRQASIRAARHGHDDLAAVAYAGRALVSLRLGEADPALFHYERALRAAAIHAAATGDAPAALDALFLESLTEALAEWERIGRPDLFDRAAALASRLKGREALRGFVDRGHGPARLATAARAHDAAERLRELAERTARLRGAWGKASREQAVERQMVAEAVVDSGGSWTARAPLLLEWLPGELPQTAAAARSVMVPGEVLLDYTVGEAHGALLVLWETGQAAHPLPGREELEASIAACEAGDCQAVVDALLGPAAEAVNGASRVLVAAHGPVHRVPFEQILPEPEVQRVPSALGLTGLRLRAWGQGPGIHPGAAALLPEGAVTDPEPPAPAEDRPGDEAAALPDTPEDTASTRSDTPEDAASTRSDTPEDAASTRPDGDGDGAHDAGGAPAGTAEVPPRDRAAWLLGLGDPRGALPVVKAPAGPQGIPLLRAACAAGRTLLLWQGPGVPAGGRLFGAPLTLPEPTQAPD